MGAPQSIPRRLISVSDYHKMGDAGVFKDTDRVELIEGELIQKAPIGGPHMQQVNLLNRMLVRLVGDDGVVSPQNPISLPPDSEPEPDLVVLRPEWLRRTEVPSAQDVLLVVEISVTTFEYDRDVKTPLYARHAIPEVWIFEPVTQSMSVYREPARNVYRRLLQPQKHDTITALMLPSVRVPLTELWK